MFSGNTSNQPKRIMVLLHGYGSNGHDLITLAPDFAEALDDTLFISPHAPFAFEGGIPGAYQWYSLTRRDTEFLLGGYANAKPKLEQFLNEVSEKFQIPFEQIVLAGFSQGGMMSMHYGLTSEKKFAAVMSFSGYILDCDYPSHISKPKMFVSHGDFDMVVPFTAHQFTVKKLQELGVDVTETVSQGLGHGIDYTCINAANRFLKTIL
jgi:phospholipase/carboxylesterase